MICKPPVIIYIYIYQHVDNDKRFKKRQSWTSFPAIIMISSLVCESETCLHRWSAHYLAGTWEPGSFTREPGSPFSTLPYVAGVCAGMVAPRCAELKQKPGNSQSPQILNLFPACMPGEVWDEITYPFPNFNGAAVEVWKWIGNVGWNYLSIPKLQRCSRWSLEMDK